MRVEELIPVYLKYLKAIGRSRATIRAVKFELRCFVRFLEKEKALFIENLTRDVLSEYQQDLAFQLTSKGTLLSLKSQETRLCLTKGFTRFLYEKDYLVSDPGKSIKLPKIPKRLPKSILSEKEVHTLMDAPDVRTNLGFRNRMILEILYDTAIRRAELSRIKISDLDLNAGFIRIQGKGDKDRVVPLSKRVCEIVQTYVLMVRPNLLKEKDSPYLIITCKGKRMVPGTVCEVVKRCANLAGIKKRVTTHTFRHTCATHMLRNGAPVRHLQEMLGHASLSSTQVYTHVTINDLKKIHAKYHPGNMTDLD